MAAPRTVKIGIAVAVLTLVAAAGGTYAYAANKPNPIKDNPPPALFRDAEITPLGQALATQKPLADQAYAQWTAAHPRRDDAAFTTFAVAHLPAPPDAAEQATELAELKTLAAARTKTGIAAATWLELYGKKNIWTLYAHDLTELQPADQGAAQKAQLKRSLALAKTLTAAAQARFQRQAPFITDPALRPDKNVQPGKTSKLSYPSKHAVYAFTALTVLSHANPPRAAEYTRMADEVAYSRLYMAGHYRSDLTAGAFLGDLIGDYETGTTNPADCPPATVPAATVPGSATPVTSAPVAWPSARPPSPTDPPTPTEPTAGCAASGQRTAGPTTSPR